MVTTKHALLPLLIQLLQNLTLLHARTEVLVIVSKGWNNPAEKPAILASIQAAITAKWSVFTVTYNTIWFASEINQYMATGITENSIIRYNELELGSVSPIDVASRIY